MVPVALVNAPPSIEYCPLLMLMLDGSLIPETKIELEVTTLLGAALFLFKKPKAFWSPLVVTLNGALTSPTVSVAWLSVESVAADVCLTTTVSLLFTILLLFAKAPPLIAYSPAEILIGTDVEIPDTVMMLDTLNVFNSALVTGIKVKASGVVSTTIMIQPVASTLLPAGVAGHWSKLSSTPSASSSAPGKP